ncbi:MAG: serine acetyltransferase, partial [Clostridiales bacterium]|nr:serine acetyltransferase [Clostridiales bacterium]
MSMKDKYGFYLDVYRKTGGGKCSAKTLFFNRDLKCLKVYRKANYYYRKNKKILRIIYTLKLKKLLNKYDFNVPVKTQIGEGLFIGHNGPIIINGDAVIGKNCNIATGVTIGRENRGKRKGCPTIGDRVWIGTNAVIVGKISIGNNVLIAPNSFVNFAVPNDSIVIGNPAKII